MTKNHLFYQLFYCTCIFLTFTSCSHNAKKQNNTYASDGYDEIHETNSSVDPEDEFDNDEEFSIPDCIVEDGAYTASVDYYNPETGYRHAYTLDVEVEDCEVVQIYFPNGGWLDSDHITPAALDDNGACTVYGEQGKTYEIQLDQ